MSTYGGVTFTASQDGWSEKSAASVGVRGFPGANNWALSLAGQREITRTIRCVFSTLTVYRSIVALRGTEASLSVDNWDSSAVDAVLAEISAETLQADGKVTATAQFILT